MGCQSTVRLNDNLTFSITTHDADTGALTDTSAAPAYRVYEDETATAILTGTMAKLDDGNTTGFYTEQIACTAANGFESGRSYTIYIEATVDGVTGGIAYACTVETVPAAAGDAMTLTAAYDAAKTAASAADVNAQVVDVLTVDTFAEPAAVPAATATLKDMLHWLFTLGRNKRTQTATTATLRNDADGANIGTASVSDDATTFTQGKWTS